MPIGRRLTDTTYLTQNTATPTQISLDINVEALAEEVGIYLDGTPHLAFGGTTGSYASIADTGNAGDLCVVARLRLSDLNPATSQVIATKRGNSVTASWRFALAVGGRLLLWTSPDGTDAAATPLQAQSTVALSTVAAPGDLIWVAARRDVDNGAGGNDTRFWWSEDGITWTQLGDTVTIAGTTSVYVSATAVTIGANTLGASAALAGELHALRVITGSGPSDPSAGTAVISIITSTDLAGLDAAATSFPAAVGGTVTLHGDVTIAGIQGVATTTQTGVVRFATPEETAVGTPNVAVDAAAFATRLADLPINPAPGTGIVWFGDSFIDRSGTQTYADGASRQANGPALWCEMLMGNRLRPLAEEGVNGETTAQFLDRIDTVLAYNPDIVGLLTAGVNDVKGAVSVESHQANLEAIFGACAAAGATVITGTIPPSDLINTAGEIANLFTMNRWLMDQARRRSGLIVVDIYSLLAASGTVAWRTDATYTSDNTHPNARGAYVIGQAFATALDKIVPGTASTVIRSDADPLELAPNPTMSGTGGTGTGVIPASVTSTGGTGTGSKVARTDGIVGDWFDWDQSAGTNLILQIASSGFSAGDRVVGRFELWAPDSTDWAPTANQFCYLEQRNASNVVVGTSAATYFGEGTVHPLFGPIIVELNPTVVDATTSTIRLVVRTVGAMKIRVGLMSLREVD